MNGVQLYIEMIDVDEDEDELIDIFIVDLILQANTSSDQPNRRGVNNIASMSLQFEAQCLPGFTGDFCMADITEMADITDTTAGDDGSLSRNGKIGIGSLAFILVIFVSIMLVLGYIVAKLRKEKKKLHSSTATRIEEPGYAALAHVGWSTMNNGNQLTVYNREHDYDYPFIPFSNTARTAVFAGRTSLVSDHDDPVDQDSINCETPGSITCEPCQAYLPQESITCEACPAYDPQDVSNVQRTLPQESITCEACPAYDPQDVSNVQRTLPQESITCEACPAYSNTSEST